MGRRRKYDYDSIKKDWESGMKEAEILLKHQITSRNTLVSMASRYGFDSSMRSQHGQSTEQIKKQNKAIESTPATVKQWQRELKKGRTCFKTLKTQGMEIANILFEQIQLLSGDPDNTETINKAAASYATVAKTLFTGIDAERRSYAEEVTMSLKKLEEEENKKKAKEGIKGTIKDSLIKFTKDRQVVNG